MTYAEFQQAVRAQRFASIYLFYGEEDFLIDEGVQAISEHALDPGMKSFNLDVMDGSKVDAKDVVAHASSFPMMGPRRIVIVREFEKLVVAESAKEIVTAYVNRPLESTCLVLVSLDPDFRRRPFTDLKKKATLVECKPLYDQQVPGWVADRIKRLGKEANADACRLIHAYVGNSLRSLQNEIDKLLIFVGDRKEITSEDVATVVGASKGYTIFELQNAIGRQDPRADAYPRSIPTNDHRDADPLFQPALEALRSQAPTNPRFGDRSGDRDPSVLRQAVSGISLELHHGSDRAEFQVSPRGRYGAEDHDA
jgi:DNA polymerase-3 subunit delta